MYSYNNKTYYQIVFLLTTFAKKGILRKAKSNTDCTSAVSLLVTSNNILPGLTKHNQ